MSEPDDKSEPETPATKAKSLFDSEWDGLLGSSASSSASRPIFAPPKFAAPPKVDAPKIDAPKIDEEADEAPRPMSDTPTAPIELPPAEPEEPDEPDEPDAPDELAPATSKPRTSDAHPSVSGEFLAPPPRPEPTTPPRYEPPEGVSPDYDNADDDTEDRLPVLPLFDFMPAAVTQDDDEPPSDEPAADPRANEETPKDGSELTTASGGAAPRVEAEPEPTGGSRKLLILVGMIAAVVGIAIFVGKTREQDTSDSTVARAPEESAKNEGRKPDLGKPARSGESDGTDEGETGGGETGAHEPDLPKPRPKPSNVDPRDPSLAPPGTPEESIKAFTKLPVSIHDGPPIGGIGRSGIHIDDVSTSRGRDNTDCDQPTEVFSLGIAKYVNVCFRVVHAREQESLRVIWEKDGKVTRRGRVRIPELHAYTTRAYLLLRPEYIGDWRVRIVPEGEEDVDLAVAEFVITE